MKFTTTALFNAIALGSGKYVQCKAYARITSVMSDPLDSGVAWTEVTQYLSTEEGEVKLPTMWTNAEWKVGKPTFDSIELEGIDIPFWRDHIFGACSSSQLIEFKIELKIGLSENRLATDVVYGFSGWVDKSPIWKEKDGLVVFTVVGYDEVGSRVSAETTTTQILDNDLDGAGLVGVVLENLPGIYVTDANITGLKLKVGIHTIQLTYTAGSPAIWEATLDGGIKQILPSSDGLETLQNKEVDQKLRIYVKVAELEASTDPISQDIIQKVYGETLVNTWFVHCWVFGLLKMLYERIGLTNYSFDNFRIKTHDDRRIPSLWDLPPGNSYYEKPTAIACDNTNNLLWIGIKDKIYSHDMSLHTYTYRATVDSGYKILKLWSDDVASGFIWGIIRDGSGNHKVIKLVISSSTLTSYSITRAVSTLNEEENFAIDLMVRGIYYINSVDIYIFLLDSLELKTQWMGGFNYYEKPAFCDGNGYYYYQTNTTAPFSIVKAHYDGTDFHFTTIAAGMTRLFDTAVYCKALGLWIGCRWDSGSNWWSTKWDPVTNTLTNVTVEYAKCAGFVSDEVNGYVYFAGTTYYGSPQSIKRINASGYSVYADTIPSGFNVLEVVTSNQVCFDAVNDRMIGFLSPFGIIFEFGQYVSMYINREANFEGMYVIDAIRELEESFNLVGVISPNKKVVIYRRSDEVGNPKTSGNTASITVNETEDIEKNENYIKSCSAMKVGNEEESHVYDGTNFDPGLLSDGRLGKIESRFIPTVILKDMAVYGYKFFNKDLSLYTFPLANVILWQYECFDGLIVTFTTTKIQKTTTGPMYGVGIDPSGSTILKVLL